MNLKYWFLNILCSIILIENTANGLVLDESPTYRPPLIEICPTSNYYTLNLKDHSEHPTLGSWIRNQYPIAVSTGESNVIFIHIFPLSLSFWFYSDNSIDLLYIGWFIYTYAKCRILLLLLSLHLSLIFFIQTTPVCLLHLCLKSIYMWWNLSTLHVIR